MTNLLNNIPVSSLENILTLKGEIPFWSRVVVIGRNHMCKNFELNPGTMCIISGELNVKRHIYAKKTFLDYSYGGGFFPLHGEKYIADDLSCTDVEAEGGNEAGERKVDDNDSERKINDQKCLKEHDSVFSVAMEICLYALFVILGLPITFTGQPACRDNQEEFGFALVGHDYKSVYADHFSRCYFECTSEERCQSVTYLWDQKECKMNNETKKSRPEDYVQNPAATYMENTFRAKKGSKSSIPGHSCREIVLSDNSQGDGEYWIDPTASGRPFTVFCDMTTDEGGWTLVHRFTMRDPSSSDDSTYESNSYQEILPKYNLNHQFLLRHGFSKLKTDMGFTQIRFYCFKKKPGSVFHITTSKNIKGTAVVDFFTVSDTMPEACGSFTRFSDDNSTLASICDEWGHPSNNRWGHRSYRTDERLFKRPLFRKGTNSNNMNFIFFRVSGGFPYCCDDSDMEASLGDTWKIFVR